MKNFSIMADATCDLNEAFRSEYDIVVIPGHFVTPDNTEYDSMPAWEHGMERDAFYADLKKNPLGYKTSPASVGEFFDAFCREAEKGNDIIVASISAGMSGANAFMQEAAQMTRNKYPDVRINVIDSMRFGPGFGLMVVHAAMHRGVNADMQRAAGTG